MHFEIENINNNNESLYFTLRHVLLAVIHVGIHPRSVKQQQYVHLAMQCYIFCIRNKIDMLHINWNDVKEKKNHKGMQKAQLKRNMLNIYISRVDTGKRKRESEQGKFER